MPRPAVDKAAERHVDSWGREGKEGRWTRIHRSARRALFTPFKVAGGPNLKTSTLKRIRITRGKFFASGKTFEVIDDWTIRANAHRVLEGSWIGTTDFRETSEFIDDDSDEDQEEKEEAAAEKEDMVKETETAAETADTGQRGGTQCSSSHPQSQEKKMKPRSPTSFSVPRRRSRPARRKVGTRQTAQ